MSSGKSFQVGLIIGTQRKVRAGPQIANFILDTLRLQEASQPNGQPAITLNRIDIAEHQLPIFDESGIPQHIKSADDYDHEHTRVWSRRIAAQDAFIFLSAQRNWGIPAELKNGIDYLYHEWKGKPALLITYGGHGGNHCADQLRSVLGAMGMQVVKSQVNMSFPNAEFRTNAFKGQPLGLDAQSDDGAWAGHRVEFKKGYEELLATLLAPDAPAA